MTQVIRAAMFDLDGTLLDTLSDIAHAMNGVLGERGLPQHPVNAYRRMVGSGLEMLVRRAVPDEVARSRSVVAKLTEDLREAYAREPVARTRPYEGIPILLEDVRARGIPMAVLSNKADELVQEVVAGFFPPDLFVVVQGMRDDVPPKPDPTSARAIASRMGVEPGEVVYLGDSDIDMHTARNAGMIAVGAGWGFRGETELRDAGAEIVIDAPGELVGVIDSRARR
jgi:phosphoglycolate phosphatase